MNFLEKLFSIGVDNSSHDDGTNLSVQSRDRNTVDWYIEDISGATTYNHTSFSNKPRAFDGPYIDRRTGLMIK